MKQFLVVFALLVMFIMVSCGSGSSKNDENTDKPDSGELVTDDDTPDFDSSDISDNDITESDDESDTDPEQPDNGDSQPDSADSSPDNDDSTNDSGDSKPDGDDSWSDEDSGDSTTDNDIDPGVCNPNPCFGMANSTEDCTAVTPGVYSCGCINGYYWWGKELGCLDIQRTIGNICTGHNKCYDRDNEIECPLPDEDFYGQDAQYAAQGLCVQPNLVVKTINGDKVVVDKNTGLKWQQSANEGTYSWIDANTYCDELTYAGFSDWRLPAPHEFLTIVDNSKYNPAIDTTIFLNMLTDDYGSFWTSKNYIGLNGNSGTTWRFDSSSGRIALSEKTKLYHAICVRGDELPSGLFTVSDGTGDAVAIDLITGLVWQKTVPKTTSSWKDALSYCENLTYADCSDWRLPNKNELASLVNYSITNPPYSDFPEISDLNISDLAYEMFWSSSTSVGEYNNDAWSIYFNDGDVCDEYKEGNYHVRCVTNSYTEPEEACEPNPCESVANSTGECRPISKTLYSCGCAEGYYWWGAETGCIDKATIGNICTGQTKCYDDENETACPSSEADFYGQDAQYISKCKARSFTVKTVSGQNIVLDNNTGLVWQQTVSAETYNWEEAQNYCDSLNSSNYAGYGSGWRLPQPQEFFTLEDSDRYNPIIDTNIFTNMPSKSIWTSKSHDNNKAWNFNPYNGKMNYDSKQFSFPVMCVNGMEMPTGVFTKKKINGRLVITDSTTGLMWQRVDNYKGNWLSALKYCEESVYAGYTDWRLPNKNELASLFNYNKSEPPYSDFPDMPNDLLLSSFWSSTTSVYEYLSGAWEESFYYAHIWRESKTTSYVNIRCVRNAD